jgi:hypothetical protein
VDVKLLLSMAVVVGMVVAAVFERRANKARAKEAAATASSGVLIVVKMPGSVSSIERAQKYDEPIEVALKRESLGGVIGRAPDLTVEVNDYARGMPLLKRELLRLGVPRETMLQFTHFGVQVAQSVMALDLEPRRRYRVIKAFSDHDRDPHPEGEEWTFLRSAFAPYHSGLSWFVSFDGVQETHIRMQSIPEEQGHIISNLAEYLVAV